MAGAEHQTKARSNMTKLKYKLWVDGNTVKFRIDEQSEKFTYTHEACDDHNFKSSNGLEVVSVAEPQLTRYTVFLRGCEIHSNGLVAERVCDNEYHAENFRKKVEVALEDWAENAPEFQAEPTNWSTL